jgi:hypothetical protein
MGLLDLVNEMSTIDRLGSGVLEALLLMPDRFSPNLSYVGEKELIVTAFWYMTKRQIVHDENISQPGI